MLPIIPYEANRRRLRCASQGIFDFFPHNAHFLRRHRSMERGLYAAATGMIAQQTIMDTLSQNIANASTPGYKQDNPTFRAMHGMALRRLENGAGRGPDIGELGLRVQADKVYI